MRQDFANGDCETAELREISGAITDKRVFAGAAWCLLPAPGQTGGHSVEMGKEPKGQEESDKATDEVIKIIARRLADTRKKRGLTQTQLGEKAGVRQSYIFELEQGSSSMTLRTLIRMARVLDVDPRDLFPGSASAPATATEIEFLAGALDRVAKAIEDRVAYERLRDEHEASLLEELKPLADIRNALPIRKATAEPAGGRDAVKPKRPRRGITEDT